MVKVVSLFLIFILVLGMFGKLRMPRLPRPFRRNQVTAGKKCPACGRYSVAGEPCPCGGKK